MADEKKGRAPRFSVGAFYCTESIQNGVNEILEKRNLFDGNAKARSILNALRFEDEWKDRVADFDGGSDEELAARANRISELEKQLKELQAKINTLEEDKKGLLAENKCLTDEGEAKDARIKELEESNGNLQNENNSGKQDGETKDARIKELTDELNSALNSPASWDQVARNYDPLYCEICGAVAEMLSTDKTPVSPIMVLMDQFIHYHLLRLTEFSFQPLLPEKKLNELIQKCHPEFKDRKGLIKALGWE